MQAPLSAARPAPESSSEAARVYVHFPYCLTKCPYCDFASVAVERDAIEHARYADAILVELERRLAAWQVERPTHTASVFFGGGTPSLWDPRELGRVLDGIRRVLPWRSDVEITVECNPSSLDLPRARALRAAGANRLSIGVQSLDAQGLAFLGRLHDADGARHAIAAAIDAGFERWSADLIFGRHGQSPTDAVGEVVAIADLGAAHISAYQLTVEPGTPFGERARRGRLPILGESSVAESFNRVHEALTDRGFEHYEISNFAKPGHASRHNLGYWQGDPYLGLGAGAVGALPVSGTTGERVRYRNPKSIARYFERVALTSATTIGEGDGLSVASERLDADTRVREMLMLGLRTREGVDMVEIERSTGTPVLTRDRERQVAACTARGVLDRVGSKLVIPDHAWLVADDTIARLF